MGNPSTDETSGGAPLAILPPVAKRVPHAVRMFGRVLHDPLAWLRDRHDPDLMPLLVAENAYADAVMAPASELQTRLFAEMCGHLQDEDETVPYRENGWLYFERTNRGDQYPVLWRRPDRPGGVARIILDANKLAGGRSFFKIGLFSVSPDGNMLAYTYDALGYEQYVLVVKDLRTGMLTRTKVERVTSVAWASDSDNLFYTTEDEVSKRSNQLHRHKVYSGEHSLLLEESDELLQLLVRRSRSGKFVYLDRFSHTSQTSSFVDAAAPYSVFTEILPRRDDVIYDITDDGGNFFYIRTNADGAVDYKIVRAPCHSPGTWEPVFAHVQGFKIAKQVVLSHHLVVHVTEAAEPKIAVRDLTSGEIRYIDFPGSFFPGDEAFEIEPFDNVEFDGGTYRFTFDSLVTPETTVECDLFTLRCTVLKTQSVNNFDRSQYTSKRIFVTAGDGAKIPVSLVYKGELVLDGSRPLHLYGYGSYGFSETANFSVSRLSLLDRGVIFAIAHVRGGSEMGEQWWLDGKLKKKMNTFTDFITCARYLIEKGYTSSDRIAAEGRSAGGLLMGAVNNLAPTLFKVMILGVPFVDMMNTMLDASLPLTTGEYGEWGNPNYEADFLTMLAYSPYDNIAAREHSASILVTSSLEDSRVGYWEPAKWVQKMRAMRTDGKPVLFKIKLDAGGHGGSSGRFDKMADTAFIYAFLLSRLEVR
jgi:oligopeptidase B